MRIANCCRVTALAAVVLGMLAVPVGRAQTATPSVPPAIEALREADEAAMHWISVRAIPSDGAAEQVYQVYLFFPAEFDPELPLDQWWHWVGGQYAGAALGVAVLGPDGKTIFDPRIVGEVFQRGLNTCQLKMYAVGPAGGRKLNVRIDPSYVEQVLKDRDSNVVMLYERFMDQLGHLFTSEKDYALRTCFMSIVPPLQEDCWRSAALLCVLNSPEYQTLGGLLGDASTAIDLQDKYMVFTDFYENLPVGRSMATDAYLADLEFWHKQSKIGKITDLLDKSREVLFAASAILRIYAQTATLNENTPAMRLTASWLGEQDSPVGTQLGRATVAAGGILESVLSEVWNAIDKFGLTPVIEEKLKASFVNAAGKSGMKASFASRSMGTFLLTTMAAFEISRYAFDTAGFKDALLTATAASQVDKACSSAFRAHIGSAASFSRTEPPAIATVEALVWVQRLQAQAASEFHRVLGEVLSDETSLLNSLHELGYEDGKIVYVEKFHKYAESLLAHAASNARDATRCCPSDAESDKVLAHLLKVMRYQPIPKLAISVEPREQRLQQGETLRFRGQVTDEDGKPASGVQVTVDDPMSQATVAGPDLVTGADGSFAYTVSTVGVPASGYEFVFAVEQAATPALARVSLKPGEALPAGMLDLVLVIDKSGSMSDDIEMVQREVDRILGELDSLAQQESISLRIGVVLFHDQEAEHVFETCPLTDDIDAMRQFVTQLNAREVGGDENLYAAMMYAMNEPVDGKQIDMGWRHGAAKIAVPITDEAPKDKPFALAEVVTTAFNLDPVHVYPLLLPKTPLSWLDPASQAMERLALETGGEAVQVESAAELPEAIVAAVKLAIRQHREEVWRQEHPPYALYAVAIAVGLVILSATSWLFIVAVRSRRKVSTKRKDDADPRWTGERREP